MREYALWFVGVAGFALAVLAVDYVMPVWIFGFDPQPHLWLLAPLTLVVAVAFWPRGGA